MVPDAGWYTQKGSRTNKHIIRKLRFQYSIDTSVYFVGEGMYCQKVTLLSGWMKNIIRWKTFCVLWAINYKSFNIKSIRYGFAIDIYETSDDYSSRVKIIIVRVTVLPYARTFYYVFSIFRCFVYAGLVHTYIYILNVLMFNF